MLRNFRAPSALLFNDGQTYVVRSFLSRRILEEKDLWVEA